MKEKELCIGQAVLSIWPLSVSFELAIWFWCTELHIMAIHMQTKYQVILPIYWTRGPWWPYIAHLYQMAFCCVMTNLLERDLYIIELIILIKLQKDCSKIVTCRVFTRFSFKLIWWQLLDQSDLYSNLISISLQ